MRYPAPELDDDPNRGGTAMMNGYGMDSWDWWWMVPTMALWVIVLALAVYAAVRLALRDERHTGSRS
jgi:hypothetical protein